MAELLARHGTRTELTPADRFAVAVVEGRLDEARRILRAHPTVAATDAEADRAVAAQVAVAPAADAAASAAGGTIGAAAAGRAPRA